MPKSYESENRAPDRRWQPRGVGLQPTFRCAGCDQASQGLGSRKLGPAKLQFCAGCAPAELEKIEARKAAREAARAAAGNQEAAPCL